MTIDRSINNSMTSTIAVITTNATIATFTAFATITIVLTTIAAQVEYEGYVQ